MVEVTPPINNDEHVIGSAIISKQETTDEKFPIPRSEYLNAILDGHAAIMKHLNPNCEYNINSITDESSSEEEEEMTTRNPLNRNAPTKQKTLPVFPMIQLKRRRVMYYAPLVVDGFEFDALVDTGACLSAIPPHEFRQNSSHFPTKRAIVQG